jgi:hypothetical protein
MNAFIGCCSALIGASIYGFQRYDLAWLVFFGMISVDNNSPALLSRDSQDDIRAPRLFGSIEPIRMQTSHIVDVAQLHFRELAWSMNGQFGAGHILELYQALAESPHFFGYVYYAKGALIGFATGTTDFQDTRLRIMKVYRRKIPTVFRILISNPRFLLAALESKFLVPPLFRRLGTSAEWLTFVTDTRCSYLAPFVSIKLIGSVKEHFQQVGVSHYVAQGYRLNPKAMRLYEKLKWRVANVLIMHVIYQYSAKPHDQQR